MYHHQKHQHNFSKHPSASVIQQQKRLHHIHSQTLASLANLASLPTQTHYTKSSELNDMSSGNVVNTHPHSLAIAIINWIFLPSHWTPVGHQEKVKQRQSSEWQRQFVHLPTPDAVDYQHQHRLLICQLAAFFPFLFSAIIIRHRASPANIPIISITAILTSLRQSTSNQHSVNLVTCFTHSFWE